jgi:hypothetical protein
MGSLFGGGKIPKPAPAPEPPPLPPPAPVPVSDTNPAVDESRREARKSELRKMGRNSTILAGGDLGANGANPGKTILGG